VSAPASAEKSSPCERKRRKGDAPSTPLKRRGKETGEGREIKNYGPRAPPKKKKKREKRETRTIATERKKGGKKKKQTKKYPTPT